MIQMPNLCRTLHKFSSEVAISSLIKVITFIIAKKRFKDNASPTGQDQASESLYGFGRKCNGPYFFLTNPAIPGRYNESVKEGIKYAGHAYRLIMEKLCTFLPSGL